MVLACLAACQREKPPQGPDFTVEEQHLSAYLGKPIALSGQVLDETGKALTGATVRFGTVQATTDGHGHFSLMPSRRGNDLLAITAPGYRMEQISVVTLLAENLPGLALDPIVMTPASSGTLRMIFGGDTAFWPPVAQSQPGDPEECLPAG